MSDELPVFPLNTVLFPGGELPLRIFELRYRRLVDLCGKQQPFVVVRIRNGREVGEPAFTFEVGTRAFFSELVSQRDGTLGALALGEQRVRLSGYRLEQDGLMFARADILPEAGWQEVPEDLAHFAKALAARGQSVPDATMLAWRLADSLPMDVEARQALLACPDANERLDQVRMWLLRHPGWFQA